MNKHTLKNHFINGNWLIIIQIVAFIAFLVFSCFFNPQKDAQHMQGLQDCALYNNNWTLSTDSQSVFFESLPDFFNTEDESTLTLTKTLADIQDGECIGFFSFQQQVQVFLDGEEIYSFLPDKDAHSKTPGNRWNFIPLYAECSGQTLSIRIHQCYIADRISVPDMYYGAQAGIALSYLQTMLPRIAISMIMILFGILIGIFCIAYQKRQDIRRGMQWLALFCIFRGCWTGIEANVYSLFTSLLLLSSQVSYLCLKLAVVTLIQFINSSFHENKNRIFHLLRNLAILDFWLSSLLQFTGILDFAYTVYFTHVIMLVGIVYTCVDIVTTLHGYRKDSSFFLRAKRKNTQLAQLSATIFLLITSISDLARYYFINSPDVARFSRIGDIIYVSIIVFALLLDFIYLLQAGQQAAIIKEKAALDPMTNLKNRSAFEHDMRHWNHRNRKKCGIIILDLNNLKSFNDTLGHKAGDQYIITASQMIHEIFSPHGNIYRIGGDEFCIITNGLTESTFLNLRNEMETRMEALSNPDAKFPMEIASGFALFDASTDTTLQDTEKRADKMMYQRKVELKGR